jgi:hypothetical protein
MVNVLRDVGTKGAIEALSAAYEDNELKQIRDALSEYLDWRSREK